jgi:hypothetical protein
VEKRACNLSMHGLPEPRAMEPLCQKSKDFDHVIMVIMEKIGISGAVQEHSEIRLAKIQDGRP